MNPLFQFVRRKSVMSWKHAGMHKIKVVLEAALRIGIVVLKGGIKNPNCGKGDAANTYLATVNYGQPKKKLKYIHGMVGYSSVRLVNPSSPPAYFVDVLAG